MSVAAAVVVAPIMRIESALYVHLHRRRSCHVAEQLECEMARSDFGWNENRIALSLLGGNMRALSNNEKNKEIESEI